MERKIMEIWPRNGQKVNSLKSKRKKKKNQDKTRLQGKQKERTVWWQEPLNYILKILF